MFETGNEAFALVFCTNPKNDFKLGLKIRHVDILGRLLFKPLPYQRTYVEFLKFHNEMSHPEDEPPGVEYIVADKPNGEKNYYTKRNPYAVPVWRLFKTRVNAMELKRQFKPDSNIEHTSVMRNRKILARSLVKTLRFSGLNNSAVANAIGVSRYIVILWGQAKVNISQKNEQKLLKLIQETGRKNEI